MYAGYASHMVCPWVAFWGFIVVVSGITILSGGTTVDALACFGTALIAAGFELFYTIDACVQNIAFAEGGLKNAVTP